MTAKPDRPGEEQRPAIREWMLAVVEHFGSARRWAGEAVTSPSNVTRFLADDNASMPSWRTIAKLAKVAPIPPPAVEPEHSVEPAPGLAREFVQILGDVPPSKQRRFVDATRQMAATLKPDDEPPAADERKKGRG